MSPSNQITRSHPNLVDHLETFLAVHDQGGFSAAAKAMGRGVSSISYSVSQLEASCGFPLFARRAGGVELTERGRSLYSEARSVVDNARRFSAHARLLEGGAETRLNVLVDVLFPRAWLNKSLEQFAKQHPRARLQIFFVSLNTMWVDLRSQKYDLAFALTSGVPSDMTAKSLGFYELAPYCAARHRLASLPEPIATSEFQMERQIYHIGSPDIEMERVGRVFSTDIWTANDVEQIRQLVINGAGWCFGADFTFENEERAGDVKRLVCEDVRFHSSRDIVMVWPVERPPGILGMSLTESLQATFLST